MQHSKSSAESFALRQQLAVLTENFTQLSGQLSQSAKDLKESGKPPLASLSDDMTTARSAFTSLCSDVVTLAQTLTVSPLPASEELTSLSKIGSLLQVVAEAEEKRVLVEDTRRKALDVTKQVLAISHAEDDAFRPLLECQANARELHQALSAATWPTIHPDSHDLAQDTHPLAMLLRLANTPDELDDEGWAECQDAVTQAFSKALAVAASRGKLTSNSPAQTQAGADGPPTSNKPRLVVVTPPPPAQTVHAAQPAQPVPVAQPIAQSDAAAQAVVVTAQAGQAQAGQVQVIDSPPLTQTNDTKETKATPADAVPSTQTAPLLSALNALEELDKNSPVAASGSTTESAIVNSNGANNGPVGRPANGSKHAAPPETVSIPRPAVASFEGSARDRAAAIVNGQSQERPSALRDLICQLLLEDKLSLAFHLACCLDKQAPKLQPRLPAWLLRALAIAPHIQSANGNLANLLTTDLAQWRADAAGGDSAEWRSAVSFLSVAATLQPALFGAQTRAPAVLRALQLGDDVPQLAAYCQLIGDFGNKRQPLDPVVFRKRRDKARWQTEVDSLRQTVESWWKRAPRLSLNYDPATKVWRKWQEPKGLLHSLLLAIRQNDPTKLPISQRVVEKLSNDGQFKREVQHTDHDILGRVLGEDIAGKHLDQLRGLVREAVGFARHWIELQEARPSRPVPKHAEQLRQEVRKRHELVLEELRTVQQRKPAVVLNSSIVCCQNALGSVWEIFHPESGALGYEPSPRALLGADLLRVPFLSIDDKGDVSGSDPESLIDVVLDLLANGLLDDG